MGARNTIVTTWVRAGVFEVDFFGSKGLRHVELVIPAMDGLVVLWEGALEGLEGKGMEMWTCGREEAALDGLRG